MRRLSLSLMTLIGAGLLATAGPFPHLSRALAQDKPPTAETLRSVNGALNDARKTQAQTADAKARLQSEAAKLRTQLVTRAAAVQAKEAEASRLEKRLAKLSALADKKDAALSDRKDAMSRLLGVLIHLSRRPPILMFAATRHSLELAHVGLVLHDMMPRLKGDANQLSHELLALTALKARVASDRQTLGETLKALATDRATIVGLLKTKAQMSQHLSRAYQNETHKVNALAAKAKSITDLLAAVEAQEKADAMTRVAAKRPKAPPPDARPGTPRFIGLRGKLGWPVAGRLVSRFGERTPEGLIAKGLKLATRAGAQVVSPANAQVAFAAPFRGYGELLILTQGDGYHLLIAGMGHIDVSVGQQVLAGEPVGTMSDKKPSSILYLELRHDGRPVDLSAWLNTSTTKVSG